MLTRLLFITVAVEAYTIAPAARPAAAAHTPPGGSLITRHYRAPAQSSQTALVPLQTGPGPVVARTREAKPILEPTH